MKTVQLFSDFNDSPNFRRHFLLFGTNAVAGNDCLLHFEQFVVLYRRLGLKPYSKRSVVL